MKIDSEQAYVLHTRPFRENSQLVDIFSRQHGRLRVVARITRSSKKARTVTAFSKLSVSWSGRTDLKTLTQAEALQAPLFLRGDRLFIGLYLNELLCRIVPEADPHERLFDRYDLLLKSLLQSDDIEPLLRLFEFSLLNELGYGLAFNIDSASGDAVATELYYQFSLEEGLQRYLGNLNEACVPLFRGEHLLALAAEDYQQQDVRRAAKQLSRLALQPHLKGRPLHSRELFMRSRMELPK